MCYYKILFQLHGCVFSQVEVRTLMDDKSLISNFTLELLDEVNNKSGTLNEIQKCFVETLQKCDYKLISNVFNFWSDIIIKSNDWK